MSFVSRVNGRCVKRFLRNWWPEIVVVIVSAIVGSVVGWLLASNIWPHRTPICHVTRMGQWRGWTDCSSSCGSGEQTRSRVLEATGDLARCFPSKETRRCRGPLRVCCADMGMPRASTAGDLQHCYELFTDELVPWQLASDRSAEWLHGDLVSIHSDEEWQLVQRLVRKGNLSPDERVWIGLQCDRKEGVCEWSDGSAFDYQVFDEAWPARDGYDVFCVYVPASADVWRLSSACHDGRSAVLAKSYAVADDERPCPTPQKPPPFTYRIGDEFVLAPADASKTKQFCHNLAIITSDGELSAAKPLIADSIAEKRVTYVWIGLFCNGSNNNASSCWWCDGSPLNTAAIPVGFRHDLPFSCGVTKIGANDKYESKWQMRDCTGEPYLRYEEARPRCPKFGGPWRPFDDCPSPANLDCAADQQLQMRDVERKRYDPAPLLATRARGEWMFCVCSTPSAVCTPCRAAPFVERRRVAGNKSAGEPKQSTSEAVPACYSFTKPSDKLTWQQAFAKTSARRTVGLAAVTTQSQYDLVRQLQQNVSPSVCGGCDGAAVQESVGDYWIEFKCQKQGKAVICRSTEYTFFGGDHLGHVFHTAFACGRPFTTAADKCKWAGGFQLNDTWWYRPGRCPGGPAQREPQFSLDQTCIFVDSCGLWRAGACTAKKRRLLRHAKFLKNGVYDYGYQ